LINENLSFVLKQDKRSWRDYQDVNYAWHIKGELQMSDSANQKQ